MIATQTGTIRTHGRGGYKLGCRCDTCVEKQRAYSREYYRVARQYKGIQPDVDAEPVRKHIRALQAAGMGCDEIARASGVTKAVVWKVADGQRVRGVRPNTARRILAVELDPYLRPSLPSVRRLRALAALGWTTRAVESRTGINARVISAVRAGGQATVTRDMDGKIRAAYDELCMELGPSDITRRRAAAAGWAPPLAWPDIDDPDATPHVGKPRTPSATERLDEWLHLVKGGEDPHRAARRVGVQLNSIERIVERHHRTDARPYLRQEPAA